MTLEIPALGRPFSLGMLYDCFEDKPIPGITLWSREDLANNISTVPQNSTDYDILTSDTVSVKSSALNVSGELKVSLWSGMVEVAGSGKYCNNTKESKKQARVTLKYRRTTRFDQLSMNHLCQSNIPYKDVFDKGIGTHVVTGILYGAQAFFIFDQKFSAPETEDVEGKLKGMAKKIENLTRQLKMNEAEKEEVCQFSCTFHGDFALEKNPVNYEEAVTTFVNLPKLLGDDGEKAVPVKVWLYPLKKLDDRAASLVRQISDHLVFRAENILQQMSEDVMECNDLMGHPAAITFPALKNKISEFKKRLENFRVTFQKRLSKVLPSIRRGNMEESILENILTAKERSPFRDKNIRTFLSRRWLEMHIVYSILKQMPDIRVVSEQRELIREILDADAEGTFCFNFSSLASLDPYLSHLLSWLHKESWDVQDSFTEGETKQWFEQNEIQKKAKEMVDYFKRLHVPDKTNLLVISDECSECSGIAVHKYQKSGGLTPRCMSNSEIKLVAENHTSQALCRSSKKKKHYLRRVFNIP